MFPIRDHNPSRATPFVTWALIAVNVLIFFSYWSLFDNPRALQAFFLTWGLVPAYAAEAPQVRKNAWSARGLSKRDQ